MIKIPKEILMKTTLLNFGGLNSTVMVLSYLQLVNYLIGRKYVNISC